ncbi:MAG TPA: hypothetical protein VLA68_03900 [Nitrososphaera sp.]|nr:hypothetical protein [Nitrososphaera sp.]
MTNDISGYFEKAKTQLRSEHESMVQKIKEEVAASKRKALSKV